MSEKPILFSAPMVRAILAGQKTQTRRVMKPQPVERYAGHASYGRAKSSRAKGIVFASGDPSCADWRNSVAEMCPFGQPGDHLWVRERAAFYWGGWHYFADGPSEWGPDVSPRTFSRPSIHMPRLACRLSLEITDVRVERLQTISEADAEAEGAIAWSMECPSRVGAGPRTAYHALWDAINGAGSWAANPWVWVVEFKRVAP